MSYAGFWRRFLAYFIDYIVILIIFYLFLGIFYSDTIIDNFVSPISLYNLDYMQKQLIKVMLSSSLFMQLFMFLYYTILESNFMQATVGKMALGIKVTDMNGRKISYGTAVGRYFGRLLSTLILFIGFIMIAFTQKKQSLHDLLTNTLVVKK